MFKFALHGSLSSRRTNVRGLTLIELLVTLVVVSILAAAALPYAEVSITRTKEVELRRALREIRTAIDRFHEDWKTGRLSKSSEAASDVGYPKSLKNLVDGAETSGAQSKKHRYLRRIPRDPFGDESKSTEEQWEVRGYDDELEAIVWSGRDVYDVRSRSDRKGLDGTSYRDW